MHAWLVTLGHLRVYFLKLGNGLTLGPLNRSE